MRAPALAAAILFALGLHLTPALADCAVPKEPDSLPDAATATDADMIAAQQAVKQYMTAMEARLKCLGESSPNYNTAVDQMQKVATRFNAAIRAFRAKHA